MPNDRLPASRLLSAQLGISRNTILLAYDDLYSEGFIKSYGPKGTFVTEYSRMINIDNETNATIQNNKIKMDVHRNSCEPEQSFDFKSPNLYDPSWKFKIDFRIGRADYRIFPFKSWQKILQNCLKYSGRNLTDYSDPAGFYELRKAISNYLRPARGIKARPEQIIITAGLQEGLNLISNIFIGNHSSVVIENPCYSGAAFTFDFHKAKIIPIDVDQDGIDVSKLPSNNDNNIKLVYVTPSHQFPLGNTLTLERRIELITWALRNQVIIIEDDYDSDFRFYGSPLVALHGLDKNQCVIYMGTFSKSLGAGLRLGYIVVPDKYVESAAKIKAIMNNGHPWLEQAILAKYIGSGSYDRHINRIRKIYMTRKEILANKISKEFGNDCIAGQDGGMHLTWHLPKDTMAANSLQKLMAKNDIGIYTLEKGPAYCYDELSDKDRIILLGYACLSNEQIEEGIDTIIHTLN